MTNNVTGPVEQIIVFVVSVFTGDGGHYVGMFADEGGVQHLFLGVVVYVFHENIRRAFNTLVRGIARAVLRCTKKLRQAMNAWIVAATVFCSGAIWTWFSYPWMIVLG